MIHVLFPLGIRLSTIVAAGAFVGLAVAQRSKLPLIAGWLWVTTFEAAFQIVSLIVDKLPLGLFAPVFFLVLAFITLCVTRTTVLPDWRYLVASLAVLAIWVATGFHLNGHEHGLFSLHTRIPDFDPTAEVMNEAAKTLWALGYFLPLLRRTSTDERVALLTADAGRERAPGRRTGPRKPLRFSRRAESGCPAPAHTGRATRRRERRG